MLRCFTAVNHLSQLDHNEADLNQFLFSYFLFTSWLHSQACQLIFFFSTVDAKKKKKQSLARNKQGSTACNQLVQLPFLYGWSLLAQKVVCFKSFFAIVKTQDFFLRNTYLTRMALGFYTFVYSPSIVYCTKGSN